LLVAPGQLPVARGLLRSVVRAASVELVRCRFGEGSTAYRAALLSGFVRAPGRSVPTVRSLQGEILPDLRRRGSWALSQGDFDLL
jgi:hypothetical protein